MRKELLDTPLVDVSFDTDLEGIYRVASKPYL